MNTKKILGIAAVTLLVAVALVGAASATDYEAGTYDDLTNKISAATAGDTIKLTANIVIPLDKVIVFPSDKELTLDLNGKTIKLATDDEDNASKRTVETGSGNFIQVKGACTIKNGTIDFSNAVTAASNTSTLIGMTLSGTDNVELNGVTIKNGNSTNHKSQTIVYSKDSGNLTIEGCTIETGSSVNDRESVCLRITSQDEEATITVKNSTFKTISGYTNVGIAIDGKFNNDGTCKIAEGSTIVLNGVTFNTGAFGYELWKEECPNVTYVSVKDNGISCVDNELYVALMQGETTSVGVLAVEFGKNVVKPESAVVKNGKSGKSGSKLDQETIVAATETSRIIELQYIDTVKYIDNADYHVESTEPEIILEGETTVVGSDAKLTVYEGAELYNNGSLVVLGKIVNNSSDTIYNYGTLDVTVGEIENNGRFENYGTIYGGENITGNTVKNVISFTVDGCVLTTKGGRVVEDENIVAPTGAIIQRTNYNTFRYGPMEYTVSETVPSESGWYHYTIELNGNDLDYYSTVVDGTVPYTLTLKAEAIDEPVDTTVANAFYYVKGYNDAETGILTPGYAYVDTNGHSFNVPNSSVDDWYLTPDMAPEGTYFHMIGTGSNDYDQMIYVSPAKLSYSKVKEGTLYVDVGTEQVITIENTSSLKPYIIFEKADVEDVFVDFPQYAITTVYEDNLEKFTFSGEDIDYDDYKGTWNVYADFSRTYDEDSCEVIVQDALYNKTPNEYKYVLIGSFKIVADKTDKDSSLTVSTDEITDGNVFSISVKTEADSYVTVEYYGATENSDDLKTVTEEDADFFYVPGQTAYVSNIHDENYGKMKVPATGELTIGIQSNVKSLTDKTYHFEVTCSETAAEKKGGIDSPLTFDIKVKGNTFTANLAKTSYVKGESVTVEGSYSNTDENFKPYVYVEGTNTAFFAPYYAVKYKNTAATPNKSVKDGEYTLVFDAKNFSDLNAGTYTVYVSKEKCSEIVPLGEGVYKQYDQTTSDCVTKIDTIKNAKVLTLVLKESLIKITDITREVQAGSKTIDDEKKGYYLRATVEAEGTDRVSFYVVGQNKLFYIDGDQAKLQGNVKTLNKNNQNYLYENSYADNKYWYDGIADDRSIVKVAQKLGVYSDSYPLYLIIDNEDGTFTVYIHIQATNETYTEYPFDTKLGLGQYYLVAQHPMADGIFNAFAGYYGEGYVGTTLTTGWWYFDEDDGWTYDLTNGGGYKSGANVYRDSIFQFNVPAVQNLTAAQKVIDTIEAAGDAQNGKDFYVVATADDAQVITAPAASYKQGETITIVIENATIGDFDNGTLEANTFEFDAENLNYIQTFAVVAKENKSTGLETVTFTLDTTGVPGGDYKIILRDGDEVKKVYDTKIIAKSTEPVVEVSVSIAGASSLTVGDTTVLTAKNSDGSTAKFAWKSSDASVASVDENGNVVAKKAGTVTITVENTVTGKTATKTIVVADKSTPVTPTPTKTPGFGILAALAGLGAVAALVLRRK